MAGQKNFGLYGSSADAVLVKLQRQKDLLANSNGEFDLLGHQELAPLQSALDAAIQRTQQLANTAAMAKTQFDSMAQSVHDALLQERGDQAALEDERHQKVLADLATEAKIANELDSAKYQKAVQEENETHDLKMRNLQQQAQAAANASKSSGTGVSTSSGTGSSAASSASATTSIGASGAIPQRLEISLNGSALGGLDPNNPAHAQRLAQILMPHLAVAIQNVIRNAGGSL